MVQAVTRVKIPTAPLKYITSGRIQTHTYVCRSSVSFDLGLRRRFCRAKSPLPEAGKLRSCLSRHNSHSRRPRQISFVLWRYDTLVEVFLFSGTFAVGVK